MKMRMACLAGFWSIASLMSNGSVGISLAKAEDVQLISSVTQSGKHYRVADATGPIYQARLSWSGSGLVSEIDIGHPSQIGRVRADKKRVIAENAQGDPLWSQERGNDPLCLPELFPEFARAYIDDLSQGRKIRCEGPVLKASKLAPFEVSMISETLSEQSGRYRFIVEPGSLGMWFFMDPITFELDLSTNRMTWYDGVLPAPVSPQGKMAYRTMTDNVGSDYPVASIDRTVFEPASDIN